MFWRRGKKRNRRTRNIISGVLVGIASIFLIAYYLEVPMGDIGRFMLATLLFVLVIIIAAVIFVALIKLPGRLLEKKQQGDQPDDESRQ